MRDFINSVDPLPAFTPSAPLMTAAEVAASERTAMEEFEQLSALLDFEVNDHTPAHMRWKWPKGTFYSMTMSPCFDAMYLG